MVTKILDIPWEKMSKDQRKMLLREEQEGRCTECSRPLSESPRMFDLCREPGHGYSGNDYRDKSICYVKHPVCHQEEDHGNIPWFTNLTGYVQSREELQRMRVRLGNRNDAVMRGMDDSYLVPGAIFGLSEKIEALEDEMTSGIEELMKNAQPIALQAFDVLGVGPTTCARILAEIDISKARYPSSLHKFAGFAPGFDRMEKGEMGEDGKRKRGPKRPYNARLRVACRVQAESFIKVGVSRVKKSEWPDLDADERTEEWKALTWADKYRLGKKHAPSLYVIDYLKRRAKTEGQDRWKSEDHRNSDGLRIMVKLFLSHLWERWRTLEGLSTERPYAITHLAHSGYISPEERGWPSLE